MKLLALLKSQASCHGDKTAHLLPDRIITYRRLWSRIERAAARLQGEWQVQPGEVVAYYGDGHPDSLVLYCALLQIGAQLLPLEGPNRLPAQRILREMKVRLLLHDDVLSLADFKLPLVHALSDMLATWCHFDPLIVEENPARPALWLRDSCDALSTMRAYALQELQVLPAARRWGQVVGPVFRAETLAGLIFPALMEARPLHFAAIDALLSDVPVPLPSGALDS